MAGVMARYMRLAQCAALAVTGGLLAELVAGAVLKSLAMLAGL